MLGFLAPGAVRVAVACCRPAVHRVATRTMGHKVSVIVREEMDNVGFVGEEVEVRAGFARNYLIPSGKAVYATDANRSAHSVHYEPEVVEQLTAARELSRLRRRVMEVELSFERATIDGHELYGSVSVADVLKSLHETTLKLELDAQDIRFASEEGEAAPNRLKSTGTHVVELQAAPDVWVPINVHVRAG